ncbi:MAG: hypothetical protein SGPRY_014092, partial [Prymnesium sp.]
MAAWLSTWLAFTPRRCGYVYDCPRNYSLAQLNASLSLPPPSPTLASLERRAIATCDLRSASLSKCRQQTSTSCQNLKHGGWCLEHGGTTLIHLPSDHSYLIPRHHVPADGIIVAMLAALLRGEISGSCKSGTALLSISDFGAGVGQYGHALLSLYSDLRWRGYDGAGNVRSFTNGFVSFFDLAVPLALPLSDWVVSLEACPPLPPRILLAPAPDSAPVMSS